jgi:hypothetical protein
MATHCSCFLSVEAQCSSDRGVGVAWNGSDEKRAFLLCKGPLFGLIFSFIDRSTIMVKLRKLLKKLKPRRLGRRGRLEKKLTTEFFEGSGTDPTDDDELSSIGFPEDLSNATTLSSSPTTRQIPSRTKKSRGKVSPPSIVVTKKRSPVVAARSLAAIAGASASPMLFSGSFNDEGVVATSGTSLGSGSFNDEGVTADGDEEEEESVETGAPTVNVNNLTQQSPSKKKEDPDTMLRKLLAPLAQNDRSNIYSVIQDLLQEMKEKEREDSPAQSSLFVSTNKSEISSSTPLGLFLDECSFGSSDTTDDVEIDMVIVTSRKKGNKRGAAPGSCSSRSGGWRNYWRESFPAGTEQESTHSRPRKDSPLSVGNSSSPCMIKVRTIDVGSFQTERCEL